MGTAHVEKSMTLTVIQQEGLTDPKAVEQELVYCLIAVEEQGYEYVEAVFVTEERAQLRMAVLKAEQDLRNAQWREKHGDCECGDPRCLYPSGLDDTFWCIRASKLIR